MNTLIKNLLELARLDSYNQALVSSSFDMSTAVKNAALSFESLAYEYGKKYEISIADNAFKYSDANGTILLKLIQHGDKKILTVENTGKGISKKGKSFFPNGK